MRHAPARLLALLLLLGAAAGAAEILLRFGLGLGDPPLARLDPETEYELVPSASYRRAGNRIAINAYGMRGREPALPRPAAERRVLLIGDSVVYGAGLDQDETLAAALERRLAAATGCAALALPLAASSWGPVNQRAALAKTGALGAEAAALVLSAHDLYDTPLPEADILPYRLARPWGALGDAAEIVAERLRQPRLHRSQSPPEARAAVSLAALDAIADQLAAAGIAPVVAYHPTRSERRPAATAPAGTADGHDPAAPAAGTADGHDPAPLAADGHDPAAPAADGRAAFRAWAEGRGLRFVDLGAGGTAPVGAGGDDGYLDDIHPDAAGAARMADALAAALAPGLPACRGRRRRNRAPRPRGRERARNRRGTPPAKDPESAPRREFTKASQNPERPPAGT